MHLIAIALSLENAKEKKAKIVAWDQAPHNHLSLDSNPGLSIRSLAP